MVNNEVSVTTMYASYLDDLRSICDIVFEEECSKGERIIQLFTCQICGEQFLSCRAFKFHCSEHRSNGYLCEDCGNFVRPNVFLEHSARHKALQNNECKHCMKQFSSMYALKRHQSSGCILEKCTICNQRVKKSKINKHKAKHSFGFQCSYCKQNFTSDQWLRRHLTKQKYLKDVKCIQCQKSFVLKCQLKQHIHKEHMPFTCSTCLESFKTERMLTKHCIIKHSSKRITCPVCDKVFTKFSSLKVHERYHSGQKPFNCKFCHESFYRFDAMQYHIQQLHEKRKYICPVCEKKYSSKKSFLDHGWLNHQELFDPELCLIKQKVPPPLYEEPPNSINKSNEKQLQNDADYQTWLANKNIIIYNCPICRAAFKNFTHLMLHLDTHLIGE